MGVDQVSGALGKGMSQRPWVRDPLRAVRGALFHYPWAYLPDSVALQTGVGPLSGDRLQ